MSHENFDSLDTKGSPDIVKALGNLEKQTKQDIVNEETFISEVMPQISAFAERNTEKLAQFYASDEGFGTAIKAHNILPQTTSI